nr:MAG: wsv131-like protein [Penaeus semisulcatus pemonivirus]
MASIPGFVKLLSKERGGVTNNNADEIFGGTVDRLLLSSPKETVSSMQHIFGCNTIHKINTRFAGDESGILTSENILVYPSQDGHIQRISTFKHLAILVSASKSNYDAQRGPCTARVVDHGNDRVSTKENTVIDLETGDYPGRTRLNHKPISDILVSRLSILDPSTEPGQLDRRSTFSIDDQLLFGFDPISEVLKSASSHLTVMHSFIMDVLASLISHVIKWGPVALESNGSELSFHAAASCITRIHQVLQFAAQATARVNLYTKVASDLNIQPKHNRKRKKNDDNNSKSNNNYYTNNNNKYGDICRCCGGRGHGKGPLIDPFLSAIGVTPTKKIKNTVQIGGKVSSIPPELIFKDSQLYKTKKSRSIGKCLDSLMVSMTRDVTGRLGIVQDRVDNDNDHHALGLVSSFDNVSNLLHRERKLRFIKQTVNDIKRIQLEKNDSEQYTKNVEIKATGDEDNTNRTASQQKGVEPQQQPLQDIYKKSETKANPMDNVIHPLILPIRSPQQQEEPPIPQKVEDNDIKSHISPTRLSNRQISPDSKSRNQQTTSLRFMGANLAPDSDVIDSRVPSVIEDKVLASNPQNRFIRARDVARKKSMNSVALQGSSHRGPHRRPVLSL